MPVIGAVQRKGNVVARVLDHVTATPLLTFVTRRFPTKLACSRPTHGPDTKGSTAYPHASVDHHHNQYVVGAVHTNTIEGFWSIFKRGVVGTFQR